MARESAFKVYCSETSIHCFKYLSEKSMTVKYESSASMKQEYLSLNHCRVFWTIMMTLSFTCTLVLLKKLTDKIEKVPIVTFRADTPLDVTEVV